MKISSASAAPGILLTFVISFPVHIFSSPTVPNVDRPIIAIAPAAWHSPVHYAEFTNQLRLAGYRSVTQRLPSCDSSDPKAQSVAVDAAFIKSNLLMPSINAGLKVVLVVHSYSGGPGAVAAKGLSLPERRAAGKPGGIIGLIFINAFIAREGQSLLSGGGGKYAPWVIEYDDGQLGVRNGEDVFFDDVPEPLRGQATAELRNQSRYSAETPCGPPAWLDAAYNRRRAYITCTLDKAIPAAAQEFMIQSSGVQWDVENFVSGHAPFLSQPKKLSDWTIKEISKFDAVKTLELVDIS